jgi:hypothetical protein
LWNVAIVYYPARKYDAVIDAVERTREPPVDPLLFLAASYAQFRRLTEAQATVKRALALDPNATVAKFAAKQPYRTPMTWSTQRRPAQVGRAGRRPDQLYQNGQKGWSADLRPRRSS